MNTFYGDAAGINNFNTTNNAAVSNSLHDSIINGEKVVLDGANTNDEINALSEELFVALNDDD